MSNHIIDRYSPDLGKWLTVCGLAIHALKVSHAINNGGHFCPVCNGQPNNTNWRRRSA